MDNKRKRGIILSGITFFIFITLGIIYMIIHYIDTSFATEVTLKFYYGDKEIDVVITDENDIKILKKSLKGNSYEDNPSCGFTEDISITFTDGERSITLYPSNDTCFVARVGDSDRYISIKNAKAFETAVNKYGMTFPCV